MLMVRWRQVLAPLFLSLLLLVTACGPAEPPSPYAQVQAETSQRGAAPGVAPEATQGGEFNRFFPKSGDGYQVVPAQEKKGFAEYKLKREGKDVAMLAISDTTGTGAAAKFQQSTEKIGGYPAVDQGTQTTAVLVGDRYQVKVLSRDDAFTRADRVIWLEKFDLNGLARLQ
ncbi:hypothetical protein [Trichothermofontia sp.]